MNASTDAKQSNMFGKSSMGGIASADDLNHYLKVTNPSAWVVLIAALLLVVGLLVWAVVAVVPVTVKTTGVTVDGSKVMCWVNEDTAGKIKTSGAKAKVGDIDSSNVELKDVPMSSSEVVSFLGSDYVTRELNLADWNFLVTIELDESVQRSDYTIASLAGDAGLVPVSLIVYEDNPIRIVLGDR